MAKTTCFWKN